MKAFSAALVSLALASSAHAQDSTMVTAGVSVVERADTAGWKTGRLGVRREVVVPRNANNAAAATLSELLAGRVAGLHVRPGTGAVGAGARLRLRGASGIVQAGEPLVVVDGVRVVSDAGDLLAGGEAPVHPSRLDDFVPEDVERVEVLSGPAAIARYGAAGADGVVEVWTRRGEMRAPRLHAFAEAGVRNDAGEYPANFGRVGRRSDGARTTACYLYFQVLGRCTPVGDSVLSFNPLEEASPFRTGGRRRVGASVAGGWMGRVAYAAGATAERDLGVLRSDQRERTDARGSLTYRFANGIEVTGSALHLRNQLELPSAGGILSTRIGAGLLGRPVDDPELRGYASPLRPAEWDTVRTSQSVKRTLGSAAAHWTPRSWVTVGGSFGIDHVDTDELVHDYVTDPGFGRRGHFTGSSGRVRRDAEGFARLEYGSPGRLHLATTLGVERHSARSREESAFGPVGDPVVQSAAWSRRRTVAAYGRQGLAWRDRLFASLTVRRDEEKGRDPLHSGALGASWELVKRATPWVDGLRLRAAYARAEREPILGLEFAFVPGQCTTIQPCDAADPLLPQRHAELEGGVDAALLAGRVDLSLTGYDRTTRDVLGRYTATGSLFNEGRVVNRGVEARMRVGAPPAAPLFWEVVGIGALNRNRLEEFDLAPILVAGIHQRHEEGRPLGSFYGRRITGFADLDGDGIVSGVDCDTFGSATCEVRLSADSEYLGTPDPTRMLSLQGRTRVRGVEISALLDHQGGVSRANVTEQVRCRSRIVCRGALDPSAPFAEQARAASILFDQVPVEDATFTRLREAAVTVAIPERWARRFGGRGMELTVAGRNLATWTGFSGLDPETASGARNPFEFRDYLGQPLPRTVTTRLDVTF